MEQNLRNIRHQKILIGEKVLLTVNRLANGNEMLSIRKVKSTPLSLKAGLA